MSRNSKTSYLTTPSAFRGKWSRPALLFALTSGMALGAATGAHATIDNTATATGSFGGEVVVTAEATVTMDVEAAVPKLVASQTGVLDISGGENPNAADAGDTVTYSMTVSNEGNVTISGVRPVIAEINANGAAGSGAMGGFSPEAADMAPGASQVFTAAYTLSDEDVYRAAGQTDGFSVNANAAGTALGAAVTSEAAAAAVTIAANPALTIAKEGVLSKADGNSGAGAETGDTITYTYTVTNAGNVAITDVTITDVHEGLTLVSSEATGTGSGPWGEAEATADALGVSIDESGPNGSWDILGAGGAVTFTYVHTVTQAEFEAQ
jgi:uncharacterized repeat protein (TIGR01451 family)